MKISLKPAFLNKKAFVDVIQKSEDLLDSRNLRITRFRLKKRAELERSRKQIILDHVLKAADKQVGDPLVLEAVRRMERLQIIRHGSMRQRHI